MDILKIKDTGVEVKKLQNQLIALGFLCHEPTGYFGTLTNTAVKKAQKKFGAIENGEVSETFFHFLEDKVKELTLWNMNELQEILQGEWLVRADEPNVIVNICNDNIKKVKGGSLFYSFDATFYSDIIGNLGLVFKNGASVVLVTKVIKEKLNDSWSVLLVDDISKALNRLAKKSRKRLEGKVLCVTGSAGKTSTVSFLGQILSHFGLAYYNEENRNLLRMIAHCMVATPSNTEFAIYEVGAMPSAMVQASKLIKPNVVVFTGTGKSHLSYMHSQLIVADIKSQLFFAIEPEGTVVLNRDDKFFKRVEEAAREFGVKNIVTFGEHLESNIRLVEFSIDARGTSVELIAFGECLDFRIGLEGKHWVMNLLAVLGVTCSFGIQASEVIALFNDITPVARRGEKYQINLQNKDVTLYNDTFNANPLSMNTAIEMLVNINSNNRKILVLGQMEALGDFSIAEHIALANRIKKENIDKVFACGESMLHTYNNINESQKGGYANDSNLLADELIKNLLHKDIIVVKGSRSNKMENILKRLKQEAAE